MCKLFPTTQKNPLSLHVAMTPSKIMIKNNMKISSEIKTQVCTVKLNFITQENEQMLSD